MLKLNKLNKVGDVMKIIKTLKNLLFVIMGFFFLWLVYIFLKSYITKNVFNLGNFIGISVSFFFSLLLFFHSQVKKAIKRICKTKTGKIVISSIIIVITMGISTASFLSYKMVKAYKNAPTPNQKVMILLGCKVEGTNPCEMLIARLDAAYDYLNDNPDVICIVSGGQGKYEEITEAAAMKTYLMQKGISEDRIIEEDKSTSTSENIKFSLALLDDKPDAVIIVTDSFHQYRTSIIAENENVSTYAINAKTNPVFIPCFWVREWFGIIKDTVKKY